MTSRPKEVAYNMVYPAPTTVQAAPSHEAPYPTRAIYYKIFFLGIFSLAKRSWNDN